jgi:hypothetical protein
MKSQSEPLNAKPKDTAENSAKPKIITAWRPILSESEPRGTANAL